MHQVAVPLALLEATMLAGVAGWLMFRHRRAVREPLHVEHTGDGDPHYVFLHGLGATHRYWRAQLAPHRIPGRITFIDLLGFGSSPKPWFRHSVERHIDRLRAAIGAQEDIVLIGHSLGAALALAYAARYPENIRRLVLISLPYFGGQSEAYRWLRQTPEGWLFTNVALMTLACVVTRRVLSSFLPYLRPDLPKEVAQDVVRHSWMASTTSLWDVVYRHDLRLDADALAGRVPVTCVHGARDMTVPADRVAQLAAGRPNWTMVVLPATDHHPWLRESRACHTLICGESSPLAPKPACGAPAAAK